MTHLTLTSSGRFLRGERRPNKKRRCSAGLYTLVAIVSHHWAGSLSFVVSTESLVAFTMICGVIDTVNLVSLVRRGFSLFAIVGVVFTSGILIGAWFQFGGELWRRRRGGQS
jgi:hypothetical protein